MFPGPLTVADRRVRDEFLAQPNCVGQCVPQCQCGADGRRIGAARAMRPHAFDERCGQQQFRIATKQDVRCLARTFQVTPLEQHCRAKARMNFPRRVAHGFERRVIFLPANNCASSRLGVMSVAGNGKSFSRNNFIAAGCNKDRAAGWRNHQWINHQGRDVVPRAPPKKLGDDTNVFRRVQHARLHCGRAQLLEDCLDLSLQHFRGTRFHPQHPARILRRQTGDGAGPVHSQGGECFQICLDARAPAAVRPGDSSTPPEFFYA